MTFGLRARVVVIAAGAMLFALVATILASSYRFHREYTTALQSRSLAIATSLEVQLQRVLQLGLPLRNLIGFEEQCQEAVRKYGGIDHALVVEPDGAVLFHSDPSWRGRRIASPELLDAVRAATPTVVLHRIHGPESYGAVVPVVDVLGEHQASIIVDFPSALVTREALGMAAANLGAGALFLVLGVGALVAVLSALVTNPLERLIVALEDMRTSATDLSRRVTVRAQGDIRRLAEAFNGLLEDLQRTTVSKAALEGALRDLGDTEERYRRLVETSPSAVLVDCSERLVFVNPAGLALLGAAAPAELLGRPVLDFVHPDSRPRLREQLHSLLGGAQVLRSREVRLQRLDGAPREVEVTAIAFTYSGVPAVQLVVQDVSERQAMQAQVVASGRLAALGTLARGVAHEINNPLSYLISGLQCIEADLADLARRFPDDPLSETLAAVGDARRGANQVRIIVSDLQAFARSPDRVEPIDLHRVLDLTASMAASQIRHRARLKRDYGEVPPVLGNEARLGQVFLNLLLNAAQACGDRPPEESEILIVTRSDGPQRVRVEVRDSGCGIPPEIRERIFDPFFTTKPVGEGSGLGLFICLGLVRAMGGDLDFESQVGGGTTFRVTLAPAQPPEAMAVGPGGASRTAGSAGETGAEGGD